jgi:hypothetical protein
MPYVELDDRPEGWEVAAETTAAEDDGGTDESWAREWDAVDADRSVVAW